MNYEKKINIDKNDILINHMNGLLERPLIIIKISFVLVRRSDTCVNHLVHVRNFMVQFVISILLPN